MARPSELTLVKHAATRKASVAVAYRAAVLAAWNAGYSQAEIARAAGVTRQAVQKIVAG